MSGRNRLAELKSGRTEFQNTNNAYEMSPQQQKQEGFRATIQALSQDINHVEENISTIAELHNKTLTAVGQQEIDRITGRLDEYQEETTAFMNSIRRDLKALSEDTVRTGGAEAQSRKAQQSAIATKLQNAAQRYSQVQKQAKELYQKRMEREIRIGISAESYR